MRIVVAGFHSEAALRNSLDHLRGDRRLRIETYSPVAPESLGRSTVPLWMFAAGVSGFAVFFWLMSHASTRAYPLDIGGRPRFAWPAFVPVAFEIGVLCTMAAGFLGFFVASRLPRLNRPIDETRAGRRALRDLWVIEVCAAPPHLEEARALLEGLEPATLEEVEA